MQNLSLRIAITVFALISVGHLVVLLAAPHNVLGDAFQVALMLGLATVLWTATDSPRLRRQ
ncbi:MAG: hypothetical protein GX483_05085 [Actinomycetaceae bacterium]|nr:hypothetical protein [Actinomycetaceae bacterium]